MCNIAEIYVNIVGRYVQHCREICAALQEMFAILLGDMYNHVRRYVQHCMEICVILQGYMWNIAERYVQHCSDICTALQKDICNIARRYIKHCIEICDYIVSASGRAEPLDNTAIHLIVYDRRTTFLKPAKSGA